MEKQDFVRYLQANNRQFSFREDTAREKDGLVVENLDLQTKTFFSDEAIAARELAALLAATHHGKNVEHITRVTGYFSKVRSWNRGKVAELIDRHRTPVA